MSARGESSNAAAKRSAGDAPEMALPACTPYRVYQETRKIGTGHLSKIRQAEETLHTSNKTIDPHQE